MGCQAHEHGRYAELSGRILGAAAADRVPVTGSWELTARCNLACSFCYIAGPAPRPGAPVLPIDEALSLADQLAEAGCLWLVLTGGEPLLYPGFVELYERLVSRGVLVTLCTNGTLLTPELADVLAARPPLAVEISLYGSTPRTFERVTGVVGSFDACHRAVELLRARGVRLRLKSTISRANVGEVDEMAAWAAERGLPFRVDALLNSRLDGDRTPLEHRLSVEETLRLDRHPARRDALARALSACEPPAAPRERLYQCGAGTSAFHIDATGRLSGCLLVREPGFDLRRGTFREGWEKTLAKLPRQRWTASVACRECQWLQACEQCPGWALVETGSTQELVHHLCRITHSRLQLIPRSVGADGERRAKDHG